MTLCRTPTCSVNVTRCRIPTSSVNATYRRTHILCQCDKLSRVKLSHLGPYSCARAGPPQSRFACRLCQCANRYTATYRRTHIPVRGRAHPNHLTWIAEDSARHAATLHASLRSAKRDTERTGKNNLAQQPASQVASLGKEGQDRKG